MILTPARLATIYAGAQGLQYQQLALGVASASLIWGGSLDETSGTTIVNDEGTAARDGTYSGVTVNSAAGPKDGANAPLWDATNDHGTLGNASFIAAWNGAEGSISFWFKASGAGVWTDGIARLLFSFAVDADNRVRVLKNAANGRIDFQREGATTVDEVTKLTVSTTAWTNVVLTWSEAGDKFIVYWNGAQEGSTQTGLGTWSGSLDSTLTTLGALSTVPTNVWDGHLAQFFVWTTPLTADDVTTLYDGGPD